MTVTSTVSVETSPPAGTKSARRVNALARGLGATRYLEIGVHKGKTFLDVDMPTKTAVDPRFLFDRSANQTDLVRFFEMTSDEWFLGHASDQKFDLIFLDGLHTFEQVFRDFCNSLMLSHEKTVWVIDDTIPRDIYGSCRNQQLAGRLRRKERGTVAADKKPGAWSGDVFKIVFAIHDFFPTLSYRTILSPGKPQTVVWRCSRNQFAPLFNDLEAISRLSYFDLQENLQIIQGGTEAEVLQSVLSSLANVDGDSERGH